MSLVQTIKELYPPYWNRIVRTNTFGDVTAARILKNKDVSELKSLFATLHGDWSDRYFYSLAMSRHFPLDSLKNWAESEPDSADAHLVYGARLLKWSWEARGYGRGTSISEEQWMEFYRRLDMTRQSLEASALRNTEDPTPWVYLIMVAVYSQYGEPDEREYFEQAINRDPENWTAHMHRLTGLSEKYGGSHEIMFDFARNAAASTSLGSLLPALLFKAHSEYWKYLDMFEGDPEAASRHLQDKLVQAETLDAYERTIGSNNYETRQAIFARINAAGWFFLAGHRKILRDELLALRGSICDVHWRWVGAEEYFSSAMRIAGVK